MSLVAEGEPPTVATLQGFGSDGRAWVRTDGEDRPVGYLLVDIVDGCAHLGQVTAHPDRLGRRLGQELIRRLVEWARERRLPAVTLTTYVDVPWNGP